MDRVERHDLINAVALAAVLLAMALGLVWGARALFRAVNDTIEADKAEEVSADGAPDTDTDDTTDDSESGDDGESGDDSEEEPTTTTAPVLRVPSDVIVRVGNGARRSGVAGAGTSVVEQGGYQTLSAKNAPSTETSVVYYIEGYEADAVQVARLLGMAATQVAPMPADPGIPQGDAHLVAILGADTTVTG